MNSGNSIVISDEQTEKICPSKHIVVGKVMATENKPSTVSSFYFWTKPDTILNPFDIVEVYNNDTGSTYGVVEEISHFTDADNFLSDYIANDFGETNIKLASNRISMNCVKAHIIRNTENFHVPVKSGDEVRILVTKDNIVDKDAIWKALRHPLFQEKTITNSIKIGYINMYKGMIKDGATLPVEVDADFLIGPSGVHLNVSGITGMAAKTSYTMFILNGIHKRKNTSVGIVVFNVKGTDLLNIDKKNNLVDEKTKNLYKEVLGMSDEPFPADKITYFYPYSKNGTSNTYYKFNEKSEADMLQSTSKLKRILYFYDYKTVLKHEGLELLFGNGSNQDTTDSIISYIEDKQKEKCQVSNTTEKQLFTGLGSWDKFIKRIEDIEKKKVNYSNNTSILDDSGIQEKSWRAFRRVVKKITKKDPGKDVFSTIVNKKSMIKKINNSIEKNNNQITEIKNLTEEVGKLKKGDIFVIDIAKLSEDIQCFVVGDVIKTIEEKRSEASSDYPDKVIIFVDELNKYASSDSIGFSQILEKVRDITERGRSKGIILFGAEQFKSFIHPRVTWNCSTFAYGKTNAAELSKSDYNFIPLSYKKMMQSFVQGEYLIESPCFNSLLLVKFPKPLYKQD